MKIIHVYKTNCLQASRVILQMKWVACTTVLLHRAKQYGIMPFEEGRTIESAHLSQRNIRNVFAKYRNDKVTWVFHAQPSLIYLLHFLILKFFLNPPHFKIIYDVHDLNEAWEVSFSSIASMSARLRHIILRQFESLACNNKSIKTITVSNGLARTIEKQYDCQIPAVVISAPQPARHIDEIMQHDRFDNAFIFFGTPERVPFELLNRINEIGCELHLYGRGIDEALLKQKVPTELIPCVRLFGPYRPDDLDFLMKYRYVLLFKPNDKTLNFRYSLPNKLFQGLSYGTKFIISENFEEISDVLGEVNGAGIVVSNDGVGLKEALGSNQSDSGYFREAYALSKNLADEARDAFRSHVL